MADAHLLDERETTSLWIEGSQRAQTDVAEWPALSLTVANPRAYWTLPANLNGDGSLQPAGVGAIPASVPVPVPVPDVGGDEATTLVVQIRKRMGAFEVLIDGIVSLGTPSPNDPTIRRHRLHWHRGLHEDEESDTAVLSPLAIVFAAEDGQRPPRSARVAVWQRMWQDAAPTAHDPVMLADTELQPHHVADPTCDVVFAPYPVVHSRQPFVAILDTRDIARYDFRLLATIGSDVFKTTVEGIWTLLGYGVAQTGNVNAPLTAAGTGITAAVVGGLAMLLISCGLPATGLAVVALPSGFTATSSYPILVAGLVKAALGGLSKYATLKGRPDGTRLRFTLPQLASTLESLAAVSALTGEEVVEASLEKSFRREAVVWAWLLDREDGAPPINDGRIAAFSANPMDVDDLSIVQDTGVQSSVRVTVYDEEGCRPAVNAHEFVCERSDVSELGAAASGTARHLARVRRAIAALDAALQAALADPNRSDWFWDRWYFKGLTAMFTGRLKQLRPNESAEALKLLSMQRTRILRRARDALGVKLYARFVDDASKGRALQKSIEDSLKRRFWRRTPTPLGWIRHLPQRIRSRGSHSIFPTSRPLSLEHVDTETATAVVREFSAYHDALASYDAAQKSARRALARLVVEWEATTSRVALCCLCDTAYVPPLLRTAPGAAFCSLVVTVPADVREIMAVTSVKERTARWLQLLVGRVRKADAAAAPTLWENVDLRDTDDDATAGRVFAQLWAEELVALFRVRPATEAEQAGLMQSACRSTCRRARRLGEWLRAITENVDVGLPMRDDPTLFATQAGRDASVLIDELALHRDEARLRRSLCVAARAAAQATERVATVFERRPPYQLPHEVLSSLFASPLDGLVACDRVGAVLNLAPAPGWAAAGETLGAAAASYPANLLLTDAYRANTRNRARDDVDAFAVAAPEPIAPMLPQAARLAALRRRAAALRAEGVPISGATRVAAPEVDDLVDVLGALDLANPSSNGAFYVPFGYGSKPPALTLPPVGAPMFGSVPVYRAFLAQALATTTAALRTLAVPVAGPPPPPPPGGGARVVYLMPTVGCTPPSVLRTGDEDPESMHPMMVQLIHSPAIVAVQFQASEGFRSPAAPAAAAPPPPPPASGAPPPTGAEAAEGHAQNAASRRLRADVSAIAWNAERVHQALLLGICSLEEAPPPAEVRVEVALPARQPGPSRAYVEAAQSPAARLAHRDRVRRAALLRLELARYARDHYVALRNRLLTILRQWVPLDSPLFTSEEADKTTDVAGVDYWPPDRSEPFVEPPAPTGALPFDTTSTTLVDDIRKKPDLTTVDDCFEWFADMQTFEQRAMDQIVSDGGIVRRLRVGIVRADREILRDRIIQEEGSESPVARALINALRRKDALESVLQDLMDTVSDFGTAAGAIAELRDARDKLGIVARGSTMAQRADQAADDEARWTRQHLLAAVAIGAAMASETVAPLPIRIRSLRGIVSQQEATDALGRLSALENALAGADALRLGELCAITRAALLG